MFSLRLLPFNYTQTIFTGFCIAFLNLFYLFYAPLLNVRKLFLQRHAEFDMTLFISKPI